MGRCDACVGSTRWVHLHVDRVQVAVKHTVEHSNLCIASVSTACVGGPRGAGGAHCSVLSPPNSAVLLDQLTVRHKARWLSAIDSVLALISWVGLERHLNRSYIGRSPHDSIRAGIKVVSSPLVARGLRRSLVVMSRARSQTLLCVCCCFRLSLDQSVSERSFKTFLV
jgi:hypothetical protein